jgi:hypothetical protein
MIAAACPLVVRAHIEEIDVYEGKPMTIVRRRVLFGLALTGAGAAVANAVAAEPAAAQPIDTKYKRRSRYQADSAEVRNFYRVNSYPAR